MSELLAADGQLFHKKKGAAVPLPVPLAPLADTHGHLTSFRKHDPAHAVARAALAGVRLLCVPVDPADDVRDVGAFLSWFSQVTQSARELLEQAADSGITPPQFAGYENLPELVDNLHFIAGVHPYGAKDFCDDPTIAERLRELLADKSCVGIGEFGLDDGPWNETALSAQEQAFRTHLRLAHELGLPVELHLRDAPDDEKSQIHALAYRILCEEGVPAAGCDLHCFTNSAQVMAPFVELGCHIAFGGASTFAKNDDIRAAAAACPSPLILSETDSPYMAPVPLRGQECEPAMVALTVQRLAQVRAEAGVATPEETYATLWHNACEFLGLG
ncbi:MAG: TatD family hydrolase [Coriobacteriales bacterium]|nr:TatD family hydrolase [Coriobacteriales bacterium]